MTLPDTCAPLVVHVSSTWSCTEALADAAVSSLEAEDESALLLPLI